MKAVTFKSRNKSILCAAVVAVLAGSCAPKSKLEVFLEPPRIKTKVNKSDSAQKHDGAACDHESARTDWVFSIVPELDFSIEDEKKEKDGYHIWIELTGAKLKLALPIITYVSEKAPKYVLDHEQGHVKICKRVYANCREYAVKAATAAIGKRFEGFGANHKLALSNAIDMAAQEIAAPYRTNSAGLADRVSSHYDQLCEKEERRDLVDRTVEDAFIRVEAENKGAQADKRSKETMPAP